MESSNGNKLEQTLQDGKLYRQVNSLIVAHLRDNNLNQVTILLSHLYCCCFSFFGFLGKKKRLISWLLNWEKDRNISYWYSLAIEKLFPVIPTYLIGPGVCRLQVLLLRLP